MIVDVFARMYGSLLDKIVPHWDKAIEFKVLPPADNTFGDIMVRLGSNIYISQEQASSIGITDSEMLAVIAHEIGHIVYQTSGWHPDGEQRADSLAADLGLGDQMIRALEKIIDSRRYNNLTSQLVGRIHFLQNMMRG